MSITVGNSATNTAGGGGTTLTINKPTGAAEGDVLVAAVGAAGGDIDVTLPSEDWVLIHQDHVAGSEITLTVALLVCGASEPSDYTFTWDSSVSARGGGITAFSGVDNTTPQDAAAVESENASLSEPNATGITTVTDGAMLVLAIRGHTGNQTTAPSGMTEAFDTQATVINYEEQASAGASGSRSSDWSASVQWIAVMAALRPDGGGGGAATPKQLAALGVG